MRAPMCTFRFAVLAVLLVFALDTQAATLTVNDSGDLAPNQRNCTGTCTLRDAIAASASGGTVAFAPGLASPITLSQGALLIDKTLMIQGPGAAKLTISANNASQIFVVSAQASISGLTLADGFITGSAGSNGADGTSGSAGVPGGHGGTGGPGGLAGGACVQVANTGALVLDHVAVRHCIAYGGSGGKGGTGGQGNLNFGNPPLSAGGAGGNSGAGGDATGGAILVYGSLSLLNSSVVDGQAYGGAGGAGAAGGAGESGGNFVYGASGVSGAGRAARGGAVFVAGSVRITNSTIAGSSGTGGTGGAGVTTTPNVTSGGAGGAARGGLIRVDASAALADLEFSTLAGGQVVGGSGGIGVAPPTHDGPPGTFSGNAISAVSTITALSSVIVDVQSGVSLCDGLVTVASGSVNMDEDGSCSFNLQGTFAQLFNPLDVNTTPWPGYLPLYHSAVINAAATCQDLAAQSVSVDQHDTPRPQGANCDLGAIEADYIFVDSFDG